MDVIINAVVLAYVSLFAFGLGDNIRGPLFSEILSEFGLSDTVGSWIFALSSLFGFSSSFLSARLGRKLGHKLLLQISLGILGLALGVFSSAQSLFQMLVAAALFGMSLGSLGYCQNALVVLGTSPIRRQQWLSGLQRNVRTFQLACAILGCNSCKLWNELEGVFFGSRELSIVSFGGEFLLALGQTPWVSPHSGAPSPEATTFASDGRGVFCLLCGRRNYGIFTSRAFFSSRNGGVT
ncbi:MAG: MFS transporter [Bdellovibrionales bacterium]|nr:MFS transporter [Bdellovibrionales bacterium]